jgi:hypothetical protein
MQFPNRTLLGVSLICPDLSDLDLTSSTACRAIGWLNVITWPHITNLRLNSRQSCENHYLVNFNNSIQMDYILMIYIISTILAIY